MTIKADEFTADDRGEGLNVDMLDVDRLREWERLIGDFGSDISHWASPAFVRHKLLDIAKRLEQEVRDVGKLRAAPDRLREAFEAGAKWVAQVDDPARSRFSIDRGFAEFIGSVSLSDAEPSASTRRSGAPSSSPSQSALDAARREGFKG